MYLVKRMISGLRVATTLTYSQTLNGYGAVGYLIEPWLEWKALSGPFLVSRTGDAESTGSRVKVPNCSLI